MKKFKTNYNMLFYFFFIILPISLVESVDAAEIIKSRGNTFNPDISVNSLFLYKNSNRGSNPNSSTNVANGFEMQESEIQFAADVDPYLRAVALFSIAKESGEFKIDPEEIYAETLQLPYVTLKAGKFKANLGKSNLYHTHAKPFIDSPMINTFMFGEEGVSETGLSASVLIPTSWYTELIGEVSNAFNEPYNSTSANSYAYVSRLRNLWDLSDELTLDWGISGASGENQLQKKNLYLGSDLTFKWRPTSQGKYRALTWSTEYLHGDVPQESDSKISQGISTYLQWQFLERWWVQARSEWVNIKEVETNKLNKQSCLVAFVPTEFSNLRLQYDHVEDLSYRPENRISLQLNISIGAHPAHAY